MADSYFNTVELNDGIVFAPFDIECGRLENGILTTRATRRGTPARSPPGCEAQFKLGIYRINKRIRERRYPLIDVERGVVVATGFFDHANEFDRYKLTDGSEHAHGAQVAQLHLAGRGIQGEATARSIASRRCSPTCHT